MKTILLSLIFMLSLGALQASPLDNLPGLQEFTSDGCSWFPDGYPHIKDKKEKETKWLSCCLQHDKAYWAGGTEDDKLKADLKLAKCVAETTNRPALAKAMYFGVRAGGSAYIPSNFRWGYGWQAESRGAYQALTESESLFIQDYFSVINDEILIDEIYNISAWESLKGKQTSIHSHW